MLCSSVPQSIPLLWKMWIWWLVLVAWLAVWRSEKLKCFDLDVAQALSEKCVVNALRPCCDRIAPLLWMWTAPKRCIEILGLDVTGGCCHVLPFYLLRCCNNCFVWILLKTLNTTFYTRTSVWSLSCAQISVTEWDTKAIYHK